LHQLEPYYLWRDHYIASEDDKSPFYGRQYSEFEFSNKIYNYYIHPQWDDIGSPTLFAKLIFTDYDLHVAIIEFIGEWNDCIQNDIMFLKNNVIDELQESGINKFILICENVLNFHAGDEDYYAELQEEISEEHGYVVLVNLQEHVFNEFSDHGLLQYITFGFPFQDFNWRKYKPEQLTMLVDSQLSAPYLNE